MPKIFKIITSWLSILLFITFFSHAQEASDKNLVLTNLPAQCPKSGLIVFPNDARHINGMSLLAEALDKARTSIDLVMYTLSNPKLVDRLVAAQERGVKVRIIKEMHVFQYETKQTASFDQDPLMQKLKDAGIAIHLLPKRFSDVSPKAQAHHKVLIVDGQYAIVMSANWDVETTYITRDFGLILTQEKHPEELKEIQTVFEADWNNQDVTPQCPSLVWGPDNQVEKLKALIKGATKSIRIYQQGFSDPEMVNLVCEKAKEKLTVQLIMVPFPFGGQNDLHNLFQEQLLAAGGDMRFNVDHYIHPKVVIVDDTTAYVGSCNFYPPSLKYNRELGVITSDPAVIRDLLTTFYGDWNSGKTYEEGRFMKREWRKIVEDIIAAEQKAQGSKKD